MINLCFTIFCSSSCASCIRSLSLLSTTKMRPWVFWKQWRHRGLKQTTITIIRAVEPNNFVAALVPDFFQSGSGSWYFLFQSAPAPRGQKHAASCGSSYRLLISLAKQNFPTNYQCKTAINIKQVKYLIFNHKNLLFYLQKSHKFTISLCFLSSRRRYPSSDDNSKM